MLSKNNIALYIFSLSWLIFSGCMDPYAEQMRRRSNQFVSDFRARGEKEKRDAIAKCAPLVAESKKYVEQYSTEKMKGHISRGELVIGMNFYEVMASLNETGFKNGVPYRGDKYTGVFGTVETFYINGWNPDYASSNPKYTLSFTNNILTSIYER